MARLETWYKQDLKRPLVVHKHTDVFNQDSMGNLIGVEVYSDGEPVALSGSISGYCLLADGTTVPAVGASRSGNKASVLIPQTAYGVPGPITITIKNVEDDNITTLCATVGVVRQSVSGNLVNPGSVVTDWSNDINDQLQAVQTAVDNVGAIVAAPFDENTVYVVGNYVTNNGNLYRITTDHASGVAWANTAKVQCTVGHELEALNNHFVADWNLIDPDAASGNETDFLPVELNVRYNIIHAQSKGRFQYSLSLYDSNKTMLYISQLVDEATDGTNYSYSCTFSQSAIAYVKLKINSAPSGIDTTDFSKVYFGKGSEYIEFADYNVINAIKKVKDDVADLADEISDLNSALGTVPSGKTVQGQITDNASDITDLKSAFESILGNTYNIFDKDAVTYDNTGYLDDGGNPVTSAVSGHTTNFISVLPNTVYRITGNIIPTTGQMRIYYYNTSKEWISRSSGMSNNGMVFTTPSNCTYIQFQYNKSKIDFSTVQIAEGEDIKPYAKYRCPVDNVARYGISQNAQDIETQNDRITSVESVIVVSPNLLDLNSASQENAYISHNGDIGASNGWIAYTEYIQIEPNTAYTVVYWDGEKWSQNTSTWYAFYNSAKVSTSGAILSEVNPANSGQNDAYIRVSFGNAINSGKPMLIKLSDLYKIGDTFDSYMGVGVTIIKGLDTSGSEAVEFLTPSIILPKKCKAVVGSQFNIYTENVLLCNNFLDYAYYWTIRPSTMEYDLYSDCLRFTPTINDIGTYTVTLNIKRKSDFVTIASQSMELEIVANTTRTGKSVLFIGDSLTNAGYYPYEIQEALSGQGVTSVGTVISHPWIDNVQKTINHEGRGGWSVADYVTLASKGGVDNAFWNPQSNKFDFSYWLSHNSFLMPDLVFINLGTNGAHDYDANIDGIDEMIASIRASSATVPILISLITPPATQDGWTYANHGGSADQFKVFELTLNSRYIEEYGNREAEHIYLSPVYFNLDRYHDYNTNQFPVSARNPELVTLQTNNVHPSIYGYYKFADVYWAMIQALL